MNWLWGGPIVVARYVIPVLILPFPFAAGWANFVLDTVDGDLLIPLGLDDETYQLIDKSADWATYVGMAIAGRRWHIRRTVWAFTHVENIDRTELIRDLFTGGELSSSGTGLLRRLDVDE
jgi:hypothetical protein